MKKIRTKYNWLALRQRTKRMMRKKHKMTIKLTDLDRVWKDYVEYGIIQPLLKYGKVVIDDKFSLEIVGRKIINHPKAYNLASQGLIVKPGGGKMKAKRINVNRPGMIYTIVFTNQKYDGKVIFVASRNLRKKVSDQLFNSTQYYRIVA